MIRTKRSRNAIIYKLIRIRIKKAKRFRYVKNEIKTERGTKQDTKFALLLYHYGREFTLFNVERAITIKEPLIYSDEAPIFLHSNSFKFHSTLQCFIDKLQKICAASTQYIVWSIIIITICVSD